MFTHFKNAFLYALRDTAIDHDGVEHAGYLSFLGLLSFFPFLVFLVAVAGFTGRSELGLNFITWLRDQLPLDVVNALLPRINEILSGPSQGLLTLSMLAALWTASSAVEGYRTILNRAYRVETPPAYIWRRLLSIAQLLILTFLIVSGMLILLFMPLIIESIGRFLGMPEIYATIVSWEGQVRLYSTLIVFAIIAIMYYAIPNVKQRLMMVFPGSLLTLSGWMLAIEGLQFYVESFTQVSLIYGSLGGIIIALLFFFVLNLIFIFGAEFNYHLMHEISGVEPVNKASS